jgi:hypothetical protein
MVAWVVVLIPTIQVVLVHKDTALRMRLLFLSSILQLIWGVFKLASNSRAMLGKDIWVTLSYALLVIVTVTVSIEHGYAIAKASIAVQNAPDQQDRLKQLKYTSLIFLVVHPLTCVIPLVLLAYDFSDPVDKDTINAIGLFMIVFQAVATVVYNSWIYVFLSQFTASIEEMGSSVLTSQAYINLRTWQKREVPSIFFGCGVAVLVVCVPYLRNTGLTFWFAAVNIASAPVFYSKTQAKLLFLKKQATQVLPMTKMTDCDDITVTPARSVITSGPSLRQFSPSLGK